MRKYFTLLMSVLAFISCSRQIDETNIYQEGKQVIYQAVQEKKAESPASKSSIEDNTIYWSVGDEINLFFGSNSAKFTSQNTEKSEIASFAGYLPVIIGGNEGMSAANTVMGLYPYDENATCINGEITTTFSNEQTATANSFAEGSFPTIAKTNIANYNLSFYNICGGLKFTVGKEGIEKVIVSGNNGEEIAGKIKVHFDDNGKPEVTEITEGKTEVTLTSATGLAVGTTYYIPVLPTVFSNGVTIRLETETQYAEKVYKSKQEIKRATWANVGQVDNGLEWKVLKTNEPLTFTSTGSTEIALKKYGSPYDITLEYKKNDGSWTPYTIGEAITLNDGEKVSFQSGEEGNPYFSRDFSERYTFEMTGDGKIAASGTVMSLVSQDMSSLEIPSNYYFCRLFTDCKNLTTAPELPATTLAESCYDSMFVGCPSLTTAPELPATTLANDCYDAMFKDCTNLTQAPELPAETLADYCYYEMFLNCKNLTQAPELPAETLADYCYYKMFNGCENLTQAPELPATTLAKYCYSHMFFDCKNLTTAPELPATTLAESCYNSMFNGCIKLSTVPELPATNLANDCYDKMFYGCTSLRERRTAEEYELPATTLAKNCYFGMFSHCTSLRIAPLLPATDLVEDCYSQMFSGCSNLRTIIALFTTTPEDKYTRNWLLDVSDGVFYKNPSAKWDTDIERGPSTVPAGWGILNYVE